MIRADNPFTNLNSIRLIVSPEAGDVGEGRDADVPRCGNLIETEFKLKNLLAMKFTAQILYYY